MIVVGSLTLPLYFTIFFNVGYGLKSPFTAVNPIDIVNQHANKALIGVKDNSRNRLSVFQSFSDKVLNSSSIALSNDSCSRSLQKLVADIQKPLPYALRILDSWGKPESGILDGNIVWEGRYYECITASDQNEIAGKYCIASILLSDKPSLDGFQSLKASIAMCFPNACTAQNISSMLSILPPDIVYEVTCLSSNPKNAVDIVGLFIFSIVIALVFLSTAYDLLNQLNASYFQYQFTTNNLCFAIEPQQNLYGFRCLLLSFSLIQNTKRLLDTTQRPTDITCLHGIRFLSMAWVILGHVVLILPDYIDNIVFFAQYTVNHFEFQLITSPFFAVDSFFYLSGLLVAYLGLKQLSKQNGKMNIPLMYFHRYLRLTPPYAFLLLMSISLYSYLGEGPFWSKATEPLIVPCQKYWFANLLYFNNLYPAVVEDECWSWSWYLANDTQFYLLSPLFLWFLYRYPKFGLGLISFVLVSCTAITGAFSSYTEQQPIAVQYGLIAKEVADFNSSLFQTTAEASNQTSVSPYISDLYAKPWCRIGAYLIGMLTGYILFYKNNKVLMNKLTVIFGWIFATAINLSLTFCCYFYYSKGATFSVGLAAFYNAVSRPVWCMGLAWVTIACVSGYGGPVNRFLSWKVFIPLSRLTYCSYLLHPLVMEWFAGAVEVQQHFSIYLIIMQFFFALVLTTISAYAVAMLVEFPFIELLKILQSRRKRPELLSFVDRESHDRNLLSTA